MGQDYIFTCRSFHLINADIAFLSSSITTTAIAMHVFDEELN